MKIISRSLFARFVKFVKNTKRSTSTAKGYVNIFKYQSCFQLDFNVSYFA